MRQWSTYATPTLTATLPSGFLETGL